METRIFLIVMGIVLLFTNFGFGFDSLCMPEEFYFCNIFESVFAQSDSNEKWTKNNIGTIEVNSELPSNFSSFEQQIFKNSNSNFIAGLILLTVIFLLLLGSHLILKRKRIHSRPYLLLIIAGILLFFGLPNLVSSTLSLSVNLLFQTNFETSVLVGLFASVGFAFVLVAAAAIILIKSKLIRQGLGHEQK